MARKCNARDSYIAKQIILMLSSQVQCIIRIASQIHNHVLHEAIGILHVKGHAVEREGTSALTSGSLAMRRSGELSITMVCGPKPAAT